MFFMVVGGATMVLGGLNRWYQRSQPESPENGGAQTAGVRLHDTEAER